MGRPPLTKTSGALAVGRGSLGDERSWRPYRVQMLGNHGFFNIFGICLKLERMGHTREQQLE